MHLHCVAEIRCKLASSNEMFGSVADLSWKSVTSIWLVLINDLSMLWSKQASDAVYG